MQVWIVDDDAGFAYQLKHAIGAHTLFQKKDSSSKISVYLSGSEFLEALSKKDAGPDLVFLDCYLGNDFGPEIYLSLDAPTREKVCFCSSMSYGLFQEFFTSQNEAVPPFVPKRFAEQKWKEIVEAASNKGKAVPQKNGPSPKSPFYLKTVADIGRLVEGIEKTYYGENKNENSPDILSQVQSIRLKASTFGVDVVLPACDRLLAYLDPAKKTGAMRLKKEIRDFISSIKKAVES